MVRRQKNPTPSFEGIFLLAVTGDMLMLCVVGAGRSESACGVLGDFLFGG